MTRPAKVDIATVGDALVATFRSAGYAGASLRDLGTASGLKSASLYHRFPNGKTDMALAALDRVGAAFVEAVLDPLCAAAEPSQRLAESAAGVARFYDNGALACLLAVMTLSDAPDPVRVAVLGMFRQWSQALGAVLAQCGIENADAAAEDRIAAIQGALILGRAGAERDAFLRAVTRLAAV